MISPMESGDTVQEISPPWQEIVDRAVHDMRTPLSTLRTSLEVLKMLPTDSEKRVRLMEILDQQVEEMTFLLTQLRTQPQSFLQREDE